MSADLVEAAARWLFEQENPPRPIIINLRYIFQLSAAQAVDAIRRTNELRRAVGQPVPGFRKRHGGRRGRH